MITPLERVLMALSHREADRVPFFLTLTTHGAREMGLSIGEYFSKASNVAEGQLRLQNKYGHDCLYAFFYASMDVEAWGGETVFFDDGPPNAGEPIVKKSEDILQLQMPDVGNSPCLKRVLDAIHELKRQKGDILPIIGVVISPFSLPVMQMGFEPYLNLMVERPELFERLMAINEEFCVSWANAQLRAGAHFVVYFDPVSSPTILPKETYGAMGLNIAGRTLSRINGPKAMHFASGRTLSILDSVAANGAAAVGVSCLEDLSALKAACRGKLTVVGNLNGIEMRRWTSGQAEETVKTAIAKAGSGGGFILCDTHGEIPWQVPDETLLAIAEAVRRWGQYPLTWPAESTEGTGPS